MDDIKIEDVPEEYRDIVNTLGLDNFLLLADLCGGLNLYIPKLESLKRGSRDREIRARFNGSNYRALAAQFRLSERQVRKIINGTRV
jgi:Mor family transcriptional regulator